MWFPRLSENGKVDCQGWLKLAGDPIYSEVAYLEQDLNPSRHPSYIRHHSLTLDCRYFICRFHLNNPSDEKIRVSSIHNSKTSVLRVTNFKTLLDHSLLLRIFDLSCLTNSTCAPHPRLKAGVAVLKKDFQKYYIYKTRFAGGFFKSSLKWKKSYNAQSLRYLYLLF